VKFVCSAQRADGLVWGPMTAFTSVERTELPPQAGLWEQLRPHWTDLVERTGVTSAFLSSRWTETWLTVFAHRVPASGVVWRSDGMVVGCALVPKTRVSLGLFPVSRLHLNASGRLGLASEHNDLLVLPDFRDAVTRDYVSLVLESRADVLSLDGVPPALFDQVRDLWPGKSWNGYQSIAPYVDLEEIGSGGDFLATLSSNTRSQIRRSLRLYEEQFGSPTLTVAPDGPEVAEYLSELIRLHDTRWHGKGQTGAFVGEVRDFHTALTGQGLEEGTMRAELIRLRFGDVTIGVSYNLICGGHVQFYQAGLLYHEDRRLKPGLTMHALAIEHYMAEGEREYDFLGGDQVLPRYKASLGRYERELIWAELPAPKLKMLTIEALRGARRRASNR
jgi:CelD/BcsL family acetyltransferase involved in cellulose biosynthesis